MYCFSFVMLLHLLVRFQMQLVQSGDRSLCNSSLVESQAAKRQKLEGGHLRKVHLLCKLSSYFFVLGPTKTSVLHK